MTDYLRGGIADIVVSHIPDTHWTDKMDTPVKTHKKKKPNNKCEQCGSTTIDHTENSCRMNRMFK